MLTKEDKILIKNVWESKKYGATRLIKEFPNKKWSKQLWKTFWSDREQRGPLNDHLVVDVVNYAIDRWRRRLLACVDAEGRHFEHYLWLLLSK